MMIGDPYHAVNMRTILAYLRKEGGSAEIHASYFGMSNGEYSSAIYRLKANGRIRMVGKSTWEVVE